MNGICHQRVQIWTDHISVSNQDNLDDADYVLQSLSLSNKLLVFLSDNSPAPGEERIDFKVAPLSA